MKNTKKIIFVIAISLIAWISTSFANDFTSTGTIKAKKAEIKAYNTQIKESLKNQREEVKSNLSEFRSQYWNITNYMTWLTQEQKDKLKEFKTENQSEIDALKSEYKTKIKEASDLLTKENLRTELKNKIDELIKTYYDEILNYFSTNPEVKAFIEARKEVFDKNQEIRKSELIERQDTRWERSETILKYKENFINKVWTKIDKLASTKPENLEKIITKIDTMITKYETSTKLTQTQKDKMISQLEALKEVVEDALSNDESNLETSL